MDKRQSPALMILFAFFAMFMAVRGSVLSDNILLSNVFGVDWRLYFQPAAESTLGGLSPYDVAGFWNPPWMLVPLLPLAKLSLDISIPIMFVLNIMAYSWAALRLGMHKVIVIPFLIFCGPIMNSVMGNVDGLLALGLLCPPWLGVVILMIKPQIGFPVILFWVALELTAPGTRKQRVWRVVRLLLPATFLLIGSWFIYGPWFLNSVDAIGMKWNTAPWPLGIPVGLWLLGAGIHKRDISFALMAVPFVTPYLTIYTWSFSAMGAFIALSSLLMQVRSSVSALKIEKRRDAYVE